MLRIVRDISPKDVKEMQQALFPEEKLEIPSSEDEDCRPLGPIHQISEADCRKTVEGKTREAA